MLLALAVLLLLVVIMLIDGEVAQVVCLFEALLQQGFHFHSLQLGKCKSVQVWHNTQ